MDISVVSAWKKLGQAAWNGLLSLQFLHVLATDIFAYHSSLQFEYKGKLSDSCQQYFKDLSKINWKRFSVELSPCKAFKMMLSVLYLQHQAAICFSGVEDSPGEGKTG